MAKFIKEVTKEVLDVESIKKAVRWHKAMSAKPVRMVMSHETERGLYVDLGAYSVHCASASACSSASTAITSYKTFYGCPVDYNDGLSFGEVLFTVEL